jgi:hypothetical protein
MTDIPGADLIGFLAGFALHAFVRWSERPRREPTDPVEEFAPWMFTSDQRKHLDDTARAEQSTAGRPLSEGRSATPASAEEQQDGIVMA